MLTPVVKVSLADEAAHKIRNGIISGYFKPGEKLIEETLSQQMKTSKGTIRAAFVQLEHEGIVKRVPNRSVTAVKLTMKDVEEIHALRSALETFALDHLCDDPRPEDIDALESIEQSVLKSVGSGAPLEESVELDIDFHEMLVRLAQNNRLLDAWRRIRSQIGLLIYSRSLHNEVSLSDGVARHEELLESVRKGDCRQSAEILREHLGSLHEWLLASYSSGPDAEISEARGS